MFFILENQLCGSKLLSSHVPEYLKYSFVTTFPEALLSKRMVI